MSVCTVYFGREEEISSKIIRSKIEEACLSVEGIYTADPKTDLCNAADGLVCFTIEVSTFTEPLVLGHECRSAPSNVGQTADSSAAPFSADIVSAVVAVCCCRGRSVLSRPTRTPTPPTPPTDDANIGE